jgi:hypothetical protein
MAKVGKKDLRIVDPPDDVWNYVIARSKKSLRSLPNELIIIIREHQEQEWKKKKRST